MTDKQKIKGILVNFYRSGLNGDYLNSLNLAIEEIEQLALSGVSCQREQLLCLVDFKQVCLTKGRKYEMTREGKEHFELIGDNNTKTWGYKNWFKKEKAQ